MEHRFYSTEHCKKGKYGRDEKEGVRDVEREINRYTNKKDEEELGRNKRWKNK
jgi:hypothetical protein